MLKIIFSEQGEPISDFVAKETAREVIEKYLKDSSKEEIDVEIHVCNEVYLESFVLHTMRKVIPQEKIEFYMRDTKFIYDDVTGLVFPDNVEPEFIFASLVEEAIQAGYNNLQERRKQDENMGG